VDTYIEYISNNRNLFQLLLGERTGGTPQFRKVLHYELELFKDELAIDLELLQKQYGPPLSNSRFTAEAITSVFFMVGGEAIDLAKKDLPSLAHRLKEEILMILRGSVT
jgi:hypothetical protein